MTRVIEITQHVDLERPVLVLALSGWVDAGSAGEAAARFLAERLDGATEIGAIDLGDLVDLQATRPMVELTEGVTRTITWPRITFTAGRGGRDVVVVHGPEPSLRWPTVAERVVDFAKSIDARIVATLGGMPAPVSHRRAVRVLATAGSRSLAQEVGPLRLDYDGPTGAQTVIQAKAAQAGIPAIGLWAQVPHYLSGTVSPSATRALLSRLQETAGVEVDLVPLDREVAEYQRQVEETVEARSDIAELVERLDRQGDDLPVGDDLVSEIEEFLRGET